MNLDRFVSFFVDLNCKTNLLVDRGHWKMKAPSIKNGKWFLENYGSHEILSLWTHKLVFYRILILICTYLCTGIAYLLRMVGYTSPLFVVALYSQKAAAIAVKELFVAKHQHRGNN